MKEQLEKLQELRASILDIDKKYREIKGYGDVSSNPCPAEVEDMMYRMLSDVWRYIENVNQSNSTAWDNHMAGNTHLPKLTASQQEKLLKAAGAGDDFQVVKPQIYARASRNGRKEFEIDLIKK